MLGSASTVMTRPGGVADLFDQPLPNDALGLAWLGQAGFALRWRNLLLLIDPYLSDHLAFKYRGKPLPHKRMMHAPIQVRHLPFLDAVLCTHRHSDHMDPVALPMIAGRDPQCLFLVPRAEHEHAVTLVPSNRLLTIEAGERLALMEDVTVTAVAAAHEEMKRNERGEHHFLGYMLTIGPHRLYHSGDTIPYAGLTETVRQLQPDLALLPVNGRDAYRASHGIPGNLTVEEAATLCIDANIPRMVPHHFGMFAFNTVDVDDLTDRLTPFSEALRWHLPSVREQLILTPDPRSD